MSDFPRSGRLLGLDHGLARVGVAVCDATQMIASELIVIERTSKKADFARINQISADEDVVGIVLGLPLDLDAPPDKYTQADTVRLWATRFAATTTLPVLLWDEQLSSEEAGELARLQKRKPTAPIDDLSARTILQRYLDAVRDGLVERIEIVGRGDGA